MGININKRKKIFFILDKWCAGNKINGASEWETNFWQSLAHTNIADYTVFHFDEYFDKYKKPGDSYLLEKIGKFQPDVICLVIYNLPGSSINVPKFETLEAIKKVSSAPLLAIWGDLELKEQVKISEAILPFVELNIFTATSAVFSRLKFPQKYAYFWVPKNPEYFNNPLRQRDIDISYVGSPKPDRLRLIRYLEKNGLNVFHTGGERQTHLTTKEFADILQRSKIVLSFSRALHAPVTNARTFEIMNCGAMVLEEASSETAKLFLPNVDYVPYFSRSDLLAKARYYLREESKRAEIANRGYLKTQRRYSNSRFWNLVLEKVNDVASGRDGGQSFEEGQPYLLDEASDELILANWGLKTIDLPWPRLDMLSRAQAANLKITDWFCRYKMLYVFYIGYARAKDWRFLLSNIAFHTYKFTLNSLPKRFAGPLTEMKNRLKCILRLNP